MRQACIKKKTCDSFSGLAHIVPKLLGPKGTRKYQPRQTYIADFKSGEKALQLLAEGLFLVLLSAHHAAEHIRNHT